MRKCILALLFLSSVGAAQKLPLFRRDPVDAERAALHEKLTRLAQTRKSLGMPEVQPASAAELEALTARTQPKQSGKPVPQRHAKPKAVAAETAWPPAPQVVAHDDQEPSLGEVARKYRAQKRQTSPK